MGASLWGFESPLPHQQFPDIPLTDRDARVHLQCRRPQRGPGSALEGVVLGQALLVAGPCRFRKPLNACEPALGLEKAPEHRVSLESNKRNFLSLSRKEHGMGDKGGKKDKAKSQKQKNKKQKDKSRKQQDKQKPRTP